MNSYKNRITNGDGIYELPIIITKKDLEIEKIYSNYYNEEYWKKYKLQKRKKK